MSVLWGVRTLSAAFYVLLVSMGCSPDPGELTVNLSGPATASPQYFHGNCFAGWSLGVDLHARETRGVDVFIASLTYRLSDQGSGVELRSETLDAEALDLTYGERASVLVARSTRIFLLVAVSSSRPVGPIAVTGTIEGRDENGQRVTAPFQLTANLVVNDPGPPGGGACSLT